MGINCKCRIQNHTFTETEPNTRLPLLEPHYKITIIKYAYVLETHPPQHPLEAEGRSPAAKKGCCGGCVSAPDPFIISVVYAQRFSARSMNLKAGLNA